MLARDAIVTPTLARPLFEIFDGFPDGGHDQAALWRKHPDGGGEAYFTQRLHSLIIATGRRQNARDENLFPDFVSWKFAQLLKFKPSRIIISAGCGGRPAMQAWMRLPSEGMRRDVTVINSSA